MSIVEVVKNALSEVSSFQEIGGGVRVITHCMYPSNSLVSVTVRGGEDTYVVSDDGGAISELTSSGVELQHSANVIANLAALQGVAYRNGIIVSPLAAKRELPVAILMVANASKEIASHLFSHTRIKRKRNFKEMVHQFLSHKFDGSRVREMEIVGASNKPHKFENVITLNGGQRLIVDPVIRDPASVNARVVANFDVKSAKLSGIEQRIIYDDEDDWSSSDINLLTFGATVVAFSKADQALQQFISRR